MRHHCPWHLTRTTKYLAPLQYCTAPLPEDESTDLDELYIEGKKLHTKVRKIGRSAKQVIVQLDNPPPIDFTPYFNMLVRAEEG